MGNSMNSYLIIGGSSGIGYEVVKKLTSADNKIYVMSRNPDKIEDLEFIKKLSYDVTSDEEKFPSIEEPLKGLVYCPGTINLKPLKSLKPKDFMDDFIINSLGAVRAIQSYLPNLSTEKNSSVVLFSTVAVQTGMAYHASVAMAKGAVEGLTKSLAAELAPQIRVNAIAPSITDTPLAERLLSTDEKRKASAKRHPLNKIGSSEEIANGVHFLLSDESLWMTGQIIHIDGGISSIKML
jgi:NAD(P)-dependent dehydrogenase (short-subunit alcohol dehydrogenase family)